MSIANYKVYIPISDDNLSILPICFEMYAKYWPDNQQYIVMGFKKPEILFPLNWKFVQLAPVQQGGASNWTKYIANYLKMVDDEKLIFALEDFIPIDYTRDDIFDEVLYELKDKQIGRFELGWDTSVSVEHEVYKKKDGYEIIEARNAMYKISTQTSLWSRKYLLKFLNQCWSPWQFEIDGSIMSFGDNINKVVACRDSGFQKLPAKWIHKGALSRYNLGKFNVLGLKLDDIKELCDKNLIKQDDLIFGQWQGYVPTFNELGGFNLDFNKFKNIESIKQYTNCNWNEYKSIYE